MHKDQLAFVNFTPQTNFLVTASIDGQINFWKKGGGGEHVEFVKEFKAHTAEVTGVACSWDGRSFASCSKDGTVKVWDVVTFDLVAVINVTKTPICVRWVHGRGGGLPLLAVGNDVDGEISVFDGRGETQEPAFVIKNVHKRPVTCIAYNVEWDCAISADESGMIEYWQPRPDAEKPGGIFEMKSATNLFEFKKVRWLLELPVKRRLMSIEQIMSNSN